MIRAALFWILLSLAPSLSKAAEIKIYSGEHEDFSRIVLVHNEGVTWKSKSTKNGLTLKFNTTNATINLDGVFEKIPRTRVSDVKFNPQSGTLSIITNGHRSTEVFSAGRNTVAIDVKSEILPSNYTSTVTTKLQPDFFPFGTPQYGGHLSAPPESHGDNSGLVEILPTQKGNLKGQKKASPKSVPELEAKLLEQLGRAASQGIAVVVDASPVTNPETKPRVDFEVNPRETIDRHVSARTALDADSRKESRRIPPKTNCYGSDVLDVSSWLMDEDPTTAISMARRGMVSELDYPSERSVQKMAQTYLALGFGAEARAIILESEATPKNRALLLEMSEIVDGDMPIAPSALIFGQDCDDPTSLWSFISGIHSEKTPNFDAIHSAFLRLPIPLRVQIGAALVERLSLSDNNSLASSIRSATQRTSPFLASSSLIFEDDSAIVDDSFLSTLAQNQLPDFETTELTPNALTIHLSAARESNNTKSQSILVAEAIAFEHKATAPGQKLLEEISLSWAANEDFAQAINAWKEFELRSRSRPDEAFSIFVNYLIDSRKDVEIAKFIHSDFFSQRTGYLNPGAALAVAEWHLDYGNTKSGYDLISGTANDQLLRVRQLRSRIANLNGEHALALSYIAAESDIESTQLRAQALSSLGRHDATANILRNLGTAKQELSREAWLSGEIDLIMDLGNSSQIDFIDFFNTSMQDVPPSFLDRKSGSQPLRSNSTLNEGPTFTGATVDSGLESRRAVLSRSKEARDVIEALLLDNRFP
ncbi:hypothetical protein R3X27_20730 [Tropicimonas sp. TH_r6]|uniref:hypothetical protein n=1 Tax=Tropicimonas sp. TH_r6 TaxID=3082085 RepID=UPI0029546BAB|nr:hypothetical protein [Tropicimonas sp. TH_r6]MDV7145114.1 hypothetical protein [Tropicimonas sp. TH_r6]